MKILALGVLLAVCASLAAGETTGGQAVEPSFNPARAMQYTRQVVGFRSEAQTIKN